MKRSEAVKRMVDCYRTCKVMRYSDDQAMDRVLEVLEELGMLPTSSHNTITNLEGKKLGESFTCTWEIEDNEEN